MDIRALIICAGEATRWKNHMGVPKHLVEIEGEKILHRTVRLLNEKGVKDVFVVSKDDPRYDVEGAKRYVAKIDYEKNADADKFLSSKELWSDDGRTLIIYGDCYFTEEAIDAIVGHDKREWTLFCRPNASKVTGTPWGECFAYSLYPEHLSLFEANLDLTAKLKKEGLLRRCGGWELYRAMAGHRSLNRHAMSSNYVEIDDWTEDFDFAHDYDEWVRRRNQGKDAVQKNKIR